MHEVSEWHAEQRAKYLAIPAELRLLGAQAALNLSARKVRCLEAERGGGGPTARMAGRQLKYAMKQLAESQREIEEIEREMSNGD